MEYEIGTAAGKVWETLQNQGELSVAQLKKATRLEAPLLDWALGWLAREEKLVFTPEKRGSFRLRLK